MIRNRPVGFLMRTGQALNIRCNAHFAPAGRVRGFSSVLSPAANQISAHMGAKEQVMGIYYNPPENLPNVARRINGETYKELIEQLEPGEVLIGHYQRLDFGFQNAPWLNSERKYAEFERQADMFLVKRLGYYAGPRSLVSSS